MLKERGVVWANDDEHRDIWKRAGRKVFEELVACYVGLAPTLHASADKHHLGQITKQGSPLLRLVLVQAASIAARYDDDLKQVYVALLRRRGHAKAKVAVARRLLVRLFIMLRDRIDYEEFRRRGRSQRSCEVPPAPA